MCLAIRFCPAQQCPQEQQPDHVRGRGQGSAVPCPLADTQGIRDVAVTLVAAEDKSAAANILTALLEVPDCATQAY